MSDTSALMKKIYDQITASLFVKGKINSDKLNKSFTEDEENKNAFESFTRDSTATLLVVFSPANDKVSASIGFPKGLNKKAVYFLKSSTRGDLNAENFSTNVISNEINASSTLDNMLLLAEEVYFPLLSNPANRASWSGPTSKDVMLKFSNFVANLTMTAGQSKGKTLLPYPPPEAFDEDNFPVKERMHLLETSVVQWAHRIASVLSTSPEHTLKEGGGQDPESEVEFWATKTANLKSLSAQLMNPKMKKVIALLNQMQSPFENQLLKLTEDVRESQAESNENHMHLKTMSNYFQAFRANLDFASIDGQFIPMIHTMVLIWKNSKSYSTKPRLSCLVQEICNGLITNAQSFVNGEIIFRLIEDESVSDAVNLLKETTRILKAFYNAFKRGQVKAAKLLEPGIWDIQEDVAFARLNMFLERCSDIQEFVQIVVEFNKLDKVFLGGTKGETLTQSIRNVVIDFKEAVGHLQHVPYDIMDINASRFDDDFYRYRSKVKDFELRLSNIINQAFDDQSNQIAQFKLLVSMEGLTERPIVKDAIDKKSSECVE